ncbi:MAG: RDD family protein [Deltaproteobacteria bacterium]|nr:MAG: RDD family protein [Deltaproteobacteria bacterium]
MTNGATTGFSGGAAGWDGVDRRKSAVPPPPPPEPFIPSPSDWQSRGIAFLIDIFLYCLLHFGGPALGFGILGGFLAVIYITFRDGLFGGQSIGKKIMGIRVVHVDGRPISYIDSSFRNVLFIVYPLIPLAVAIEAIAAWKHPERRRLGDRIARTCVVQKETVPVLA